MEKVSALPLEQQEQVLEYVESIEAAAVRKTGKPYGWMDVALRANLQGPPDWSAHLDDYLYGDKKNAL